jgi:ABC-type branched-subunit amino acid transport system ATPase component
LFPNLARRLDSPAAVLSGGEQQMLTLGQAFIAKPKLLMIDELSLGLAPIVVEELLGVVSRAHAEGTSVILVEQSVNVALTVADRACFMEKGEVRFAGPTAELLHRDDILRAVFLGGAAAAEGVFA